MKRPASLAFVVSLLLAGTLAGAFASGGPPSHIAIVVTGDGRADLHSERPEDRDCFNAQVAAEIRDATLREKANALLWSGDLASGTNSRCPPLRKELESWVNVMEPLYKKKVMVLAVRGNHEAHSADSVKVWNEVFSGPHRMPSTGPAEAKNLTYWVTIGNVLILGIDQYAMGTELSPVPWVRQTLEDHGQEHVFAFGHEPAFMSGAHKDNLSANAKNRDEFIEALMDAGSQAYFAGHDHFYDHMIATDDQGRSIHQIVAGTAGAPEYDDRGYTQASPGWKTERVMHVPKENGKGDVYGYVLVEVDGPKATLTFKGRTGPGTYVPMDTWSYTAKAP
ncbi:MAG TPA: metallophosphoesterase [Candidatus Saccharimonadales bacterium]|nr:metallophosphoesterase [Candidatus Saccharimonadales bacterium]